MTPMTDDEFLAAYENRTLSFEHWCFQLMETENEELFEAWTAQWDDLVDFEVVPVTSSPFKHDELRKS